LQLNTPYTTKLLGLQNATKITRAIGILTVLSMLGYSAYNAVAIQPIREEIKQLKAEKKVNEQKVRDAEALQKKFAVDPETIKSMANIDEQLKANALASLDIIQHMSSLISAEVSIQSFSVQKDDKLPLSIKMEAVFAANNDVKIDQTLDNIEKFRGLMSKKFPDYQIEYTNIPSDALSVTASNDVLKNTKDIVINIAMSGPVSANNTATNNQRGRNVPPMGGRPMPSSNRTGGSQRGGAR
jgi:hypothetical protein